jgi:hypothetical protein
MSYDYYPPKAWICLKIFISPILSLFSRSYDHPSQQPMLRKSPASAHCCAQIISLNWRLVIKKAAWDGGGVGSSCSDALLSFRLRPRNNRAPRQSIVFSVKHPWHFPAPWWRKKTGTDSGPQSQSKDNEIDSCLAWLHAGDFCYHAVPKFHPYNSLAISWAVKLFALMI